MSVTYNDKYYKTFVVLYFLIGFFEMSAEVFLDKKWILISKPFLMPLLLLVYLSKSRKIDLFFILGLIFNFVANILFVYQRIEFDFYGNIFLILTKILFVILIINYNRNLTFFPVFLGFLPFLSLYIFITQTAFQEIGNGLMIFISQAFIIAIFGAVSVSSYILNPNKANVLLLISAILFAFSQFTFVLRLFYSELNIFQPMAMFLFIVAQFLLTQSFLIFEERQFKYLN